MKKINKARSWASTNYTKGDPASRAMSKIKTAGPDECWLFMGKRDENGYGRIMMPDHKQRRAHRVVHESLHGKVPDGLVVCHRCNNPPCCNPAHLYAGTRKDNARDAARAGTMWRGFKQRRRPTKLTESFVCRIRQLHGLGLATQAELAERYHVTQANISAVVRRKTWVHV